MRATLRLTEIIPGLHVGMPTEKAHEVILAEVERLNERIEHLETDLRLEEAITTRFLREIPDE